MCVCVLHIHARRVLLLPAFFFFFFFCISCAPFAFLQEWNVAAAAAAPSAANEVRAPGTCLGQSSQGGQSLHSRSFVIVFFFFFFLVCVCVVSFPSLITIGINKNGEMRLCVCVLQGAPTNYLNRPQATGRRTDARVQNHHHHHHLRESQRASARFVFYCFRCCCFSH